MIHDEMIQALADVRDQLIRDRANADAAARRPAPGVDPMSLLRQVVRDWHDGAKENHEALQHRGTDCCDRFTVEDIMRMVDDAERDWKKGKR